MMLIGVIRCIREVQDVFQRLSGAHGELQRKFKVRRSPKSNHVVSAFLQIRSSYWW